MIEFFTPLGDRILIETLLEEEMTRSGIVIPDTAKEKPQRGTVLAVGPGALVDGKRVPIELSPGDVVVFSKYGGTEIKLGGGEEYVILREADVFGVIDVKK